MERRLGQQDKSVAQKTALCRISSLPAGALAFQRSEDRSDTELNDAGGESVTIKAGSVLTAYTS